MSGFATFQSEPCFANLLTLLAATKYLVNGLPGATTVFVTTGRKARPVSNVTPVQQPALFLMEGEIDYDPDDSGLSRDEIHAAILIYFWNGGGDQGVPAQSLNAITDAVIWQLRQMTLNSLNQVIAMTLGDRQTLGGTCYSARVKGKALRNEGLQNNQGAIILPISILTGV